MSEQTSPAAAAPSMADAASETTQFDAIVDAAFGDTARSSGSLESTTTTTSSSSSPSADGSTDSTSQSVPSLVTTTTTSAASSKTPSPCPSILRSNSAPPSAFPTLSSSGSGSASPNVTFAPLPQTEPRKRNSSHPLGVAARSRLLRHRRMLRERGLNPDDYPYQHPHPHQQQYEQQYQYQYGYGSGVESHPYGEDGPAIDFPEMQGEEGEEEHVRVRRVRTVSEGEEEDPFVALGKLVKGAGKTLWKSLSMRDLRGKERDGAAKAKNREKEKDGGADGLPRTSEGGEEGRGGGAREKRSEEVPRRSTVHLFDNGAAPQRPGEEGGVWEEEVTEDSWKKLLSKPEPVPERTSEETNEDGQATPTPASIDAAAEPTFLTTVVVAQPSTKAR